ncbi:hypothetical protein Dimus_019798 [Dionaea muscipula]
MKHPKAAPAPTSRGGGSTAVVAYPGTTNRYIRLTADDPLELQPVTAIVNTISNVGQTLEHTTRKAETVIGNVYNHLRISPGAAMSRLATGTKVLAEGGREKVFRQTFGTVPAEELKKTYACYWSSTSSGPVAGTLYITTQRIAFCGENPLCRCTDGSNLPAAQVEVKVRDLKAVHGAVNQSNPLDKYIKVVTRNGKESRFMGFISYDKALKNLQALTNN